MNDGLVKIDVELLVLRYGLQRVLRVLAQLDNQTLEQLEQRVRDLRQQPRLTKQRKSDLDNVVLEECGRHPEIADELKLIAARFRNHTLLPHLRDVRRFLDRLGSPVRELRSRAAAGAPLIRALSQLSRTELVRLATMDESSKDSDYAVLSRAIIGGDPVTKRR